MRQERLIVDGMLTPIARVMARSVLFRPGPALLLSWTANWSVYGPLSRKWLIGRGTLNGIREGDHMQMRRKLVALVAPLLIVPAILAVGTTTANADTLAGCASNLNACWITEDMGNGYCSASIFQTDSGGNTYVPSGTFARASFNDDDTGYACNFFFQRNVNFTGWYNIDTVPLPSGGYALSPNEWNGPGYEARVCLQFNWGSSLGAMHCTPLIAQELLISPAGRSAGNGRATFTLAGTGPCHVSGTAGYGHPSGSVDGHGPTEADS